VLKIKTMNGNLYEIHTHCGCRVEDIQPEIEEVNRHVIIENRGTDICTTTSV
jgi:hypothetical protein